MSSGWYIGLTATGKSIIRAISSSSGSADADKIPRLDANGKIDISMLPNTVTGGVEVKNASNQTLGTATTLKEGNNVSFSFSGGTLTISSLVAEQNTIFDPISDFNVFHIHPVWTVLP